ncbi:MAG TPA: hypothetical protein VH643_06015 [Gemmataceae bacterium]|jgi:hypothetical protein
MSFFRWLNAIRGDGARKSSADRPTVHPILESLEERITPTDFGTYTNTTVQIVPNLFNLTVTEKVTANVTVNGTFDPMTHAFTPGTGPAVSTGMVLFNLNNQQQLANVNSNGQATASFTLPILTLFTSQALQASYEGATLGSDTFESSQFLAPLYTNFDNLIFVATLTFGTLTHQQQTGTFNPTTGVFVLPSFNTAQGESNNMGVLNFHYDDPGTITTFEAFGSTFPGSLAFKVGAYGPEFM